MNNFIPTESHHFIKNLIKYDSITNAIVNKIPEFNNQTPTVLCFDYYSIFGKLYNFDDSDTLREFKNFISRKGNFKKTLISFLKYIEHHIRYFKRNSKLIDVCLIKDSSLENNGDVKLRYRTEINREFDLLFWSKVKKYLDYSIVKLFEFDEYPFSIIENMTYGDVTTIIVDGNSYFDYMLYGNKYSLRFNRGKPVLVSYKNWFTESKPKIRSLSDFISDSTSVNLIDIDMISFIKLKMYVNLTEKFPYDTSYELSKKLTRMESYNLTKTIIESDLLDFDDYEDYNDFNASVKIDNVNQIQSLCKMDKTVDNSIVEHFTKLLESDLDYRIFSC